jgi:uncharacterized protein YjbJ (UPF0337 family)
MHKPNWRKEMNMNKDILEGNWKQLKGHVKEMWGSLTDDELEQIDGHRERLAGMLQVIGTSPEAEDSINDFLDRFEEVRQNFSIRVIEVSTNYNFSNLIINNS